MEATRPTLGVCSWSLGARGPGELVERVQATGLGAVQLALDPLRTGAWSAEETRARLAAAGIAPCSGMMAMAGEDYATLESIRASGGVRVDARWEENRRAAVENARLARALGLRLVTFHAGFLPEEPGTERAKLVGRLRELCDVFADQGVAVAFETGQETTATLLEVLAELERPRAGVNFDPANLLLYGTGEPVTALADLAARVLQIHVKDARRTRVPGTWGEERPVGAGEVDWGAFFALYRARGLGVDLVIERESGGERLADVRAAAALVERELARRP